MRRGLGVRQRAFALLIIKGGDGEWFGVDGQCIGDGLDIQACLIS
jgi:hypothetical protein